MCVCLQCDEEHAAYRWKGTEKLPLSRRNSTSCFCSSPFTDEFHTQNLVNKTSGELRGTKILLNLKQLEVWPQRDADVRSRAKNRTGEYLKQILYDWQQLYCLQSYLSQSGNSLTWGLFDSCVYFYTATLQFNLKGTFLMGAFHKLLQELDVNGQFYRCWNKEWLLLSQEYKLSCFLIINQSDHSRLLIYLLIFYLKERYYLFILTPWEQKITRY